MKKFHINHLENKNIHSLVTKSDRFKLHSLLLRSIMAAQKDKTEKEVVKDNNNGIREKTLGPGLSIYDLPRRLVLYIMGFLSPKDVLNVARCSKPVSLFN
jgi:hypothetical protein